MTAAPPPAGTDVVVVGGGPAGLALALALVRLGVRTTVLERSAGGRRDFRGESLSPDGVRLLDRCGVLEQLRAIALPVRRLEVADGGRTVLDVGFESFPYPYRFPLEIPQSLLLAEIEAAARCQDGFRMLRGWTAKGLLSADGRTTGVRAAGPGGAECEIRARLTVGADGRYGRIRKLAELDARVRPLDRDVIWMRLPRPVEWTDAAYRIRIRGDRHALLLPDSGGTVRVGLNIPKGGLRELRRSGLDALHGRLGELAPELAEPARQTLRDWSDTALLDIFSTTVPHWSAPGVVLIGDAAHTLSPVLGQGVNHALADAAALAPLAAAALHSGEPAGLDRATGQFQRQRSREVARSRRLQLRQERIFTWSAPAAVAVRRGVYRALDTSARLRARMLEPAYFADQRAERARGARREDHDEHEQEART
ncbi:MULTISPECIES: FAD-dependent monooxygenase [unclassified Streptomyces]|uniref:FAD-dependent monooxygenase n=1 Tax=unclassified Streptomyces TaxID=2593676 RepID=UPI0031BA1552